MIIGIINMFKKGGGAKEPIDPRPVRQFNKFHNQKSNDMKHIRYLLCLPVFLVLAGCATTTHVRTNMEFSPEPEKIDKTILLDVPQETRDYVAEARYVWQAFRIPVGQAVEPNALQAFGSVIRTVHLQEGKELPDRTIEVSILPDTGIRLGFFTFSKNTFSITLQCDVKKPGGEVVWSGTASAESSKRKAGGFLGGGIGYSAYTAALREAAEDAMQQALQKLANDLYAAKDQAF